MFVALVMVTMVAMSGLASAQRGAEGGEWRYYGGDAGSTKYAPLDQITRDNAADLEIAWRWRTDNFGPRPDFNYQATPLMVGGVLYTTAGWRRNVVAIDGTTGETLWMHGMTRAIAVTSRRCAQARVEASPTGRTGRTTSGFSTSRRATISLLLDATTGLSHPRVRGGRYRQSVRGALCRDWIAPPWKTARSV